MYERGVLSFQNPCPRPKIMTLRVARPFGTLSLNGIAALTPLAKRVVDRGGLTRNTVFCATLAIAALPTEPRLR